MPDGNDGFRFVQFDFAGAIGIPEGRWVVRSEQGAEAEHVLIVARHPAGPRRRRARRIEAEPPADALGITRVTVVDATGAVGPEPEPRRAAALAVVADAMTAWRVAALDPYAPESPPAPVAVRIGTGSGEQVAHGHWRNAAELPVEPRRAKRRRPTPPEGRFAEILGARRKAPACALLAVRARLDLDTGRSREALIGIEAAINCAREELGSEIRAELVERITAHSVAAAAAAAEARSGEPSAESVEAATAALERLEAALRSMVA